MIVEADVSGDGTAEAAGEQWHFCLYVAGQSAKSTRAFANLHKLCEERLPGRYHIEVIDLVEHPALARGEDILAVPTLVRCLPKPERRVIGDLSDVQSVLIGLSLDAEVGP